MVQRRGKHVHVMFDYTAILHRLADNAALHRNVALLQEMFATRFAHVLKRTATVQQLVENLEGRMKRDKTEEGNV